MIWAMHVRRKINEPMNLQYKLVSVRSFARPLYGVEGTNVLTGNHQLDHTDALLQEGDGE